MDLLERIDIESWDEPVREEIIQTAVNQLEKGLVLFFPRLDFSISEQERKFLSADKVDPKTKNISFDLRQDSLGGTLCQGIETMELKGMLKRYAIASRHFLEALIPHYKTHLVQGKTSFRPVEIEGRKSASYRKDDTRLHVDSFPSNPTKGKRILRVFTNINDLGKPRVWRLGEPFEDVVKKWAPKASSPIWGIATFLRVLKITKDHRSPYDHYMLQMHDRMKGDMDYQRTVPQQEVHFPAGSSWIVFTDQVSHAAMSGQHVLEQTFHLPSHALKNESLNPLNVLEKFFNKPLVTR